jgi:hypothetical protein
MIQAYHSTSQFLSLQFGILAFMHGQSFVFWIRRHKFRENIYTDSLINNVKK